jgi:hypothetical protein
MANRLSVLQKAARADVKSDPFPYVVVRDALPAEVCESLIQSYPPLAVMDVDQNKNNSRWSYSAPLVKANDRIPALWKEFVAYHASEAFYREVIDLFAPDILRLYPKEFPNEQALLGLKVGTRAKRSKGAPKDKGVSDIIDLDAQISGNTPVTTASSVRTTHVDKGDKLFSGLFYMRRDEDDSRGGDLTISRFKPRFRTREEKLRCFDGVYVDDDDVETVTTIPYAKNVLVLFINSIDSLHGVTVRHPTKHPRIFLNLIGELGYPLYETPSRKGPLQRMLKAVGVGR